MNVESIVATLSVWSTPDVDIRADFWSLRFVEETSASYAVRKNVPLPFAAATDRGVMASVYVDGGYGYAATSDTSRSVGGAASHRSVMRAAA